MTINYLEISENGWCKQAIKIESPNFNTRPLDVAISLAVIHSISLPPDNFYNKNVENFFQNKLNFNAHPYFNEIKNLRVSAHFLIKRDGQLLQFVSCLDRAWHAGDSTWKGQDNCNDFSIGIELVGSDKTDFDEAQYTSLNYLIKALKKTYNIEDVAGHYEISPGRKTDPGPFFNWTSIR